MNALINLLRHDAPYLDSSRDKGLLIGFLSVFTLSFLYVYNPFNMNLWGGSIPGYILIGASIMVCSQFGIKTLFKDKKPKLYKLILFGISEILTMAFFIQLAYGPEFPSFKEHLGEYLTTIKYTGLILAAPYAFFVWYLAFRHKISIYKEINKVDVTDNNSKADNFLTITGENNKVTLAINYDQLLYVKSSGNYLDIFHLKGQSISKELVRASLKELEGRTAKPFIVRVHRSFMINIHKISSIKRTKKGYEVFMQYAPEDALPISSSYKGKFEEALRLYLPHWSQYRVIS